MNSRDENEKISIIVAVYNSSGWLRDLLEDIISQSFSDFRVYIVNDGSTDDSQSIIDEYCDRDGRFFSIVQENRGVSSARNTGLNHARGEYVTFYDPDDTVPANSLEEMYKQAVGQKADIVIGGRTFESFGIKKINRQAREFASKEIISKFDEEFAFSFSVCNKLFYREIIEKNNIRFRKLNYWEDGLFVFETLVCCGVIAGCSREIYNYKRRPFYYESSLSQNNEISMIHDMEKSKEIIMSTYINMVEGSSEDNKREIIEAFADSLTYRQIDMCLLNQFYRKIWTVDDKTLDYVNKLMSDCFHSLSEKRRKQLIWIHRDIKPGDRLRAKAETVEAPAVAIILGSSLAEDKANMVLASIYGQSFPEFVVYMSKGLYDRIDEEYMHMYNLFCMDSSDDYGLYREIIKEAKAEYLILIDEPAFFEINTLRKMLQTFKENPECDMVLAEPKCIADDGVHLRNIKKLHSLYKTSLSDTAFNRKTNRWYDSMHVNKLVRVGSVCDERSIKAFWKPDWKVLGREIKVKRHKSAFIIIEKSNETIEEEFRKKHPVLMIKQAVKKLMK